MKSRSVSLLKTSGLVQACNGIALPSTGTRGRRGGAVGRLAVWPPRDAECRGLKMGGKMNISNEYILLPVLRKL